MGRTKDRAKPAVSDAQPAAETKDAPTPPPVFLVYASERPGSWRIGDDFVGLTPGLNIRTAAQWAGAEANEAVAKLIADKKITTTDKTLRDYDSVAARTALAETSTDPTAVAWMYEQEAALSPTAGPSKRRQPKIVELLARSLKRIRKRQPTTA